MPGFLLSNYTKILFDTYCLFFHRKCWHIFQCMLKRKSLLKMPTKSMTHYFVRYIFLNCFVTYLHNVHQTVSSHSLNDSFSISLHQINTSTCILYSSIYPSQPPILVSMWMECEFLHVHRVLFKMVATRLMTFIVLSSTSCFNGHNAGNQYMQNLEV